MRSQPPWDDDLLRRWLVERAPPLTWRGIAGWALALLAGLVLGLAKLGTPGELLGLGLGLSGGVQVLRGMFRMAWLALGGTDQPVRTYVRKRLEDEAACA
jgi:hypothetical protein